MTDVRNITSVDDLTDEETLDLGQKLAPMGTVDSGRLCTTVVEMTHGSFIPTGGVEVFTRECNERIAGLLGEEVPKSLT